MRGLMMLLSVTVLSFTLGTLPTKAAVSYTFATIDFPGSIFTVAVGIDNFGQIVGVFKGRQRFHGFLLDNGGHFHTIDFPGSTFTQLRRINDDGQILGNYRGGTLRKHGFLSDPPYGPGDFTTIDVPFPGALNNSANGLNDLGQVAGVYTDANGKNHSFFADPPYEPTNFTSFDVPLPGAGGNGAAGINNDGQIVGGFFANGTDHGYLANPPYGPADFTSFDFPGAIATCPVRLNNQGDIVGAYLDASSKIHGFVMTGGVFETIDFPGASPEISSTCGNDSGAFGVNDNGQIVGSYKDGTGRFHGYLATPVPQPAKPRPRR